MWLLHQFTPQMSAYNIPIALRFNAELNIDFLRQACEHILQQHPVLNSIFRQHKGELHQIEQLEHQLAFEHETTGLLTEAEITTYLREKSKQPFNLKQGPLFRVHVVSPNSGEYQYVLITVHHIVFDGSSAVLLIKTLMHTYQQLLAGVPPVLKKQQAGYDDFVLWQQQFIASRQGQAQLDYWQTQLSGELPVLTLPYDYSRPVEPHFKGTSYEQRTSGSSDEWRCRFLRCCCSPKRSRLRKRFRS